MFDLKQLQYMEAVYRHKSFTRASEELFVSQPAISASINALEKAYGVQLIVRNPKKVVFTPEGEQFMLLVNRILNECSNAEKLLSTFSSSTHAIFNLGVSPTLTLRLLPKIYSEFMPAWPKAQIRIDEGVMNNHVEKVQRELLDLSFNSLPKKYDSDLFEMIPVTTSSIIAVMREDHPLAKYDVLPFSYLDGQDIVMLDEKSQIRTLVTEEFRRKGIAPHFTSIHEQIFCMLNMVQTGQYVGFMNTEPGCTETAVVERGLVSRPFDEPINFDVGFIIKKGRPLSPITRSFIRYIKSLTFPLKTTYEQN